MEKRGDDNEQGLGVMPAQQGLVVLSRRSLLMLGLGAGVVGLSWLRISGMGVSDSAPAELPAGFSYLTFEGKFLTYEGNFLILEHA